MMWKCGLYSFDCSRATQRHLSARSTVGLCVLRKSSVNCFIPYPSIAAQHLQILQQHVNLQFRLNLRQSALLTFQKDNLPPLGHRLRQRDLNDKRDLYFKLFKFQHSCNLSKPARLQYATRQRQGAGIDIELASARNRLTRSASWSAELQSLAAQVDASAISL
jgi:hypothetical protein